ncbi:hypothetical protein ['Santalum album' aster yellows phytoplasma]|uniref:Sequence-variable mosaic (SVM) signal sequence domain-containing protein n=1 Tax='Santalum album' aster yellows phytoplasma TaxID=2831467 RepID=A0ABS5LL40_9MOLU|nr:hypothetical protein ['Santalum album' aster yellows phytoplasma]MBS2994102.1 hypothetical protein ['Santalum album' aster yellows phytoplasma]
MSKVKQYLIKNKVFWYFNYFLVAVCFFLLLWLHIKVFAKKHSNPHALKGGIFVGMGPVCVQSDEDASVSDSHLTLEDERLTGFEVLLLKEIAKQKGKELELTINTFAGLLGDI